MTKCAIIGSMGYIGRNLYVYLSSQDCQIDCYDIHPKSIQPNYTQIDITQRESLHKLNINVDCIFLIGGLTGTSVSFDKYKDFVEVDLVGVLNILDYVRKSEFRPRIIFPSSRLVYKGSDKPLKVIDEKEPKTIYAICKLAAEHSLAAYANAFDIPYTILRVCVPYGSLIDGEYSYGTVGFMLQKAKAGEDITLFDGGQYKRTFTNMKDLCKQFYKAGISAKAKNRIYNITGDTYTIREVADFISTKYNISIKEIPYPEQEKKLETGNTFFEDNNHS